MSSGAKVHSSSVFVCETAAKVLCPSVLAIADACLVHLGCGGLRSIFVLCEQNDSRIGFIAGMFQVLVLGMVAGDLWVG